MKHYLQFPLSGETFSDNNKLIQITGITGTLASVRYTLKKDFPQSNNIQRFLFDARRQENSVIDGTDNVYLSEDSGVATAIGVTGFDINGKSVNAIDLFSAKAGDNCSFNVGIIPSDGTIAFGCAFDESAHAYSLAIATITLVDDAGTHVIGMDTSAGNLNTFTSDTTSLTLTAINFTDTTHWVNSDQNYALNFNGEIGVVSAPIGNLLTRNSIRIENENVVIDSTAGIHYFMSVGSTTLGNEEFMLYTNANELVCVVGGVSTTLLNAVTFNTIFGSPIINGDFAFEINPQTGAWELFFDVESLIGSESPLISGIIPVGVTRNINEPFLTMGCVNTNDNNGDFTIDAASFSPAGNIIGNTRILLDGVVERYFVHDGFAYAWTDVRNNKGGLIYNKPNGNVKYGYQNTQELFTGYNGTGPSTDLDLVNSGHKNRLIIGDSVGTVGKFRSVLNQDALPDEIFDEAVQGSKRFRTDGAIDSGFKTGEIDLIDALLQVEIDNAYVPFRDTYFDSFFTAKQILVGADEEIFELYFNSTTSETNTGLYLNIRGNSVEIITKNALMAIFPRGIIEGKINIEVDIATGDYSLLVNDITIVSGNITIGTNTYSAGADKAIFFFGFGDNTGSPVTWEFGRTKITVNSEEFADLDPNLSYGATLYNRVRQYSNADIINHRLNFDYFPLRNNGNDIRISLDQNGKNLLPFDLNFFDPETRTALVWVLFDNYTESNREIYIHYNPDVNVDGYKPDSKFGRNGTWSSQDYTAALHSGEFVDIVGNNYQNHDDNVIFDQSKFNQYLSAVKPYGNRIYQSIDLLYTIGGGSIDGDPITISAWFKVDQYNDDRLIVELANSGDITPSIGIMMNSIDNPNQNCVSVRVVDGNLPETFNYLHSDVAIPLNEWTHVVMTYDYSTLKLYINGNTTPFELAIVSNREYSTITFGDSQSLSVNNLVGALGDVRVATTVYDTTLIGAIYNNQNDVSSFWTVDGAPAYFNTAQWNTVRKINGIKPSARLDGVTVVLTQDNLPPDIFEKALDGGEDIIVTQNENGYGRLPIEIVEFDKENKTAIIWVRFRFYSQRVNSLYIWYDNALASLPAVDEQFGRNDVWQDCLFASHDGFTDVTGKNTINPVNGPTRVVGPFGNEDGAVDFDTTNYINAPVTIDGQQDLTLTAWANVRTIPQNAGIVGLFDDTQDDRYFAMVLNSPDATTPESYSTSFRRDNSQYAHTDFVPTTGEWNRYVAVHSYLDVIQGRFNKFNKIGNAVPADNFETYEQLTIGRLGDPTPEGEFDGQIAEVQVRADAITDDRLSLEYRNQVDPSSFWSLTELDNQIDEGNYRGALKLVGNDPLSQISSVPLVITENVLSPEFFTRIQEGYSYYRVYDGFFDLQMPLIDFQNKTFRIEIDNAYFDLGNDQNKTFFHQGFTSSNPDLQLRQNSTELVVESYGVNSVVATAEEVLAVFENGIIEGDFYFEINNNTGEYELGVNGNKFFDGIVDVTNDPVAGEFYLGNNDGSFAADTNWRFGTVRMYLDNVLVRNYEPGLSSNITGVFVETISGADGQINSVAGADGYEFFKTRNVGQDIRFCMNPDGTGRVPHEIVEIDIENEKAVIWIKFENYSPTNKELYMFYDSDNAEAVAVDAPNGRNDVWTDYVAVLHLNDYKSRDSFWVDSTGNNYEAIGDNETATNVLTSTLNHPFDAEWSLIDGDNDYLMIDNVMGGITGANFTMQVNFNANLLNTETPAILSNYGYVGSSDTDNYFRLRVSDSEYTATLSSDTGVLTEITGGTPTTNDPKRLSLMANATELKLYEDTVQIASATGIVGGNTMSRTDGIFGGADADEAADKIMFGNLGELWIKNAETSEDQLALEYDNQYNNETFWEAVGAPVEVNFEFQYNVEGVDLTLDNWEEKHELVGIIPIEAVNGFNALVNETALPANFFETIRNNDEGYIEFDGYGYLDIIEDTNGSPLLDQIIAADKLMVTIEDILLNLEEADGKDIVLWRLYEYDNTTFKAIDESTTALYIRDNELILVVNGSTQVLHNDLKSLNIFDYYQGTIRVEYDRSSEIYAAYLNDEPVISGTLTAGLQATNPNKFIMFADEPPMPTANGDTLVGDVSRMPEYSRVGNITIFGDNNDILCENKMSLGSHMPIGMTGQFFLENSADTDPLNKLNTSLSGVGFAKSYGLVQAPSVRISENEDGTSQLPVEIEFMSSLENRAIIWTRFPTYDLSQRTMWIHYGRANTTGDAVFSPYGRNNVWEDYEVVLHTRNVVSGRNKLNNYSLINSAGTLTQVNDMVNKPRVIETNNPFNSGWFDIADGDPCQIEFSVGERLNSQILTMQGIYEDRAISIDDEFGLISNRTPTSVDNFFELSVKAATHEVEFADNTLIRTLEATRIIDEDTATVLAMTTDSVSVRMFEDGIQRSFVDGIGTPNYLTLVPGSTDLVKVGRTQDPFDINNQYDFVGNLGEIWISKVSKTASQLSLEYNNQFDQPNFWNSTQLNHEWKIKLEGQPVLDPITNNESIETLPVFVAVIRENNLPENIWDVAKEDGSDIRIYRDESKTQPLAFDIVNYNPILKKLEIWVRIEDYSNATDQYSVIVFYGANNAIALSDTHPQGTYATWSNYATRRHFNEDNGLIAKDSAGQSFTTGEYLGVLPRLNDPTGAQLFINNDDGVIRIDDSEMYSDNTGEFWIGVDYTPLLDSTEQVIFAANGFMRLTQNSDNTITFSLYDYNVNPNSSIIDVTTTNTVTIGAKNYINIGVVYGADIDVTVVINDNSAIASTGTLTSAPADIKSTDGYLYIGAIDDQVNATNFEGYIEDIDVRADTAPKSFELINLEDFNRRDTDNFWTQKTLVREEVTSGLDLQWKIEKSISKTFTATWGIDTPPELTATPLTGSANIIPKVESTYRDLDLKLKVHPERGDIRPLLDVAAIKNSINNILKTRPGEKPFDPAFGCDMHSYLFEPDDIITRSAIRRSIEDSLERYEPRFSISNVDVSSGDNAYNITISGIIINSQRNVDITLLVKRYS